MPPAWHPTLATVAADNGAELEAALEVPGPIALKRKVVTADAACTAIAVRLQRSRTAAAIGAWRDSPTRTQLLCDSRSCFGKVGGRASADPEARLKGVLTRRSRSIHQMASCW